MNNRAFMMPQSARRLLSFSVLLMLFLLVSSMPWRGAVAQTVVESALGCGRTATGGASYAKPNVLKWRWGMDTGEFSTGRPFYDWLADPTTTGTYVLARVRFDRKNVLIGGQVTGDPSCYTRGAMVKFDASTAGTIESMWLAFDPGRYQFTRQPSGTIGGLSFSNKFMARKQNNAELYFSIVGYFDAKRPVPDFSSSSTERAVPLPNTASIISGGYSAVMLNIPSISLANLTGYTMQDGEAPFLAAQAGYARFASCGTRRTSNESYCTYGPSSHPGMPGGNENKVWQFDYVVTKTAARSMSLNSANALGDADLPSIAVSRLYQFTDNIGGNDQVQFCVQGTFNLNAISGPEASRCAGTSSVNPPQPPIVPTCTNYYPSGTTSVDFNPVGWSDFTGNLGGIRFTQGTQNVKAFTIGLNCNYQPTVTLVMRDEQTCTGITSKDVRGVLCNTALTTPKPKVNFQVFRALTPTSTQCTLIDGLSTNSSTYFAPIALGTTIGSSALNTSSKDMLNNDYLWSFCARYYTEQTNEDALGYGDVQGRLTYEFNYN